MSAVNECTRSFHDNSSNGSRDLPEARVKLS